VLKNKKDKTATTTSRKSSFNEKQRSKSPGTGPKAKQKRFSKSRRHLGISQAKVFFFFRDNPAQPPLLFTTPVSGSEFGHRLVPESDW
jgi:hypothetical protein